MDKKVYNKHIKAIDKIVSSLKLEISIKGYRENMGYDIISSYMDKLDIVDYQAYCSIKSYFNSKIDSL